MGYLFLAGPYDRDTGTVLDGRDYVVRGRGFSASSQLRGVHDIQSNDSHVSHWKPTPHDTGIL